MPAQREDVARRGDVTSRWRGRGERGCAREPRVTLHDGPEQHDGARGSARRREIHSYEIRSGEADGEALVRRDREPLDQSRGRPHVDRTLRHRDLPLGRAAMQEVATRPLTIETEAVGIQRDALAAEILAVRGHAPDAGG